MAAAKPGKPGRGAGGRDAAYEKVKLIVPDCTDEEVQQALQQSLGDADQAVIALTDRREWEAVDSKKKKKKPAARPPDKPFDRNDRPDRPPRDSSHRDNDRPRPRPSFEGRGRGGARGRGGDRGDFEGAGGRGRGGRGGRGRGAGRGPSVDREATPARRDFSSPDPGLGSTPEPPFASVADENQGDNASYAAPPRPAPSSAVVSGSGISWASKVKATPAPAPEPTHEAEPQPAHDELEYDQAGHSEWAPQEPAPEEHDSQAGHADAFAPAYGHDNQHSSAWDTAGRQPDWSTAAGDAGAPDDAFGNPPGAQQDEAPFQERDAVFEMQELDHSLPAAQQYGGDGGKQAQYAPQPAKGENQLHRLFPPAPQEEPKPPSPPPFAQQYSQFGQPQEAAQQFGQEQPHLQRLQQEAPQTQQPLMQHQQLPQEPEEAQQEPPPPAPQPAQPSEPPQAPPAQPSQPQPPQQQRQPSHQQQQQQQQPVYDDGFGGMQDGHGGAQEYGRAHGQKQPDFAGHPEHEHQHSHAHSLHDKPAGMPDGGDGELDKHGHGGGGDPHASGGHQHGFPAHVGQDATGLPAWGQVPGAVPQDMYGMPGRSGAAMMQPGMQGMMPGMQGQSQMPQYGGMAPHMQGGFPFAPQGAAAPYGNLGYAAPPQPYQQHMNFGMQGNYGQQYAQPYGYAPHFPGAGAPGQYPGQNGSSFGSGKFAGAEFQRGGTAGSGSPAANGGGRGRGGGNPGRGGKMQLKGTRGTAGPGSGGYSGGPGNGAMDAYGQQQPPQQQQAMFTPGGAEQGWGGQHGQQASFSKDGKASGQHSGYGAQFPAQAFGGYEGGMYAYPPQQQQPPQGGQQHGGHYGGGFGAQQPVWPTSDKPFGGKGGAY